jgi:hypothetical protein
MHKLKMDELVVDLSPKFCVISLLGLFIVHSAFFSDVFCSDFSSFFISSLVPLLGVFLLFIM